MRKTGIYENIGELRYFIPDSLPPKDPTFAFSAELLSLYGQASFALGQLNEMSVRLPDQHRFIKAYVIKEALLSSAIEGIHTTLLDVFTHEIGESKANKDTQLVLNYTKALNAAFNLLKDENFPLVSRVILQAHKVLMSEGENEKASPGNYRRQSVRVGDLVPPPAKYISQLMSGLEKYINEPSDLPPLIRAGLVHVHFETIHPFLDGNGRIGRLLIVLQLIHDGILQVPILYPSYYFKKHHLEYYQRLDSVRTKGDFEGWIAYYLKAIRDSAHDAYKRAKEIEELEDKLKHKIMHDQVFVKIRETAEAVLDILFQKPIITISEMSTLTQKAYNTISNILAIFVEEKIVQLQTKSKRNKLYSFQLYLDLLQKEYSNSELL